MRFKSFESTTITLIFLYVNHAFDEESYLPYLQIDGDAKTLRGEGRCDFSPNCTCISASNVFFFHCEGELHLHMESENSTTFIEVECNSTLAQKNLDRNHYSFLELERFRDVRTRFVACPEPRESYATIFFPPATHARGHIDSSVEAPIISNLEIFCGDVRNEFFIENAHLRGLSNLKKLEINCPALLELPHYLFQGNTPNLVSLRISNTRIEHVPEMIFSGLSKLTLLSLMQNRIKTLKNDIFYGLDNLNTLWLHHNELSSLNDDLFRWSRNITSIRLERNRLTNLPKSLADLVNLRILSLADNSLTELRADDCEGFSKLEHLFLAKNNIAIIDVQCFARMKSIAYIDLSENPRIELPKLPLLMERLQMLVFENNSNVNRRVGQFLLGDSFQVLSMRNSSVAFVEPNLLYGLLSLAKVDFSMNSIGEIGEGFFSRNPSLKIISLRQNKISTVPPSLLAKNPLLEHLDVSSNKITTLPSKLLEKNTRIVNLTISANLLEELPKNFLSGLRSLRTLDLSRNKIRSLEKDSFSGLGELVTLDLSYNMISELPTDVFASFEMDGKLEIMSLEGNRLSSLSPIKMPNLHSLNLAVNNLTSIANAAFLELPELKLLNISRNNLKRLANHTLIGTYQKVSLDLSFNQLQYFPENAVSAAKRLIILNLSGNKIQTFHIESIGHTRKLRQLNLSFNGLTFIGFKNFYAVNEDPPRFNNLKIVNLSNNRLIFNYTSFIFDKDRKTWGRPSPLIFFTRVEEIYLAHNLINRIAMDWRNSFSHLRLLDLRHNKLEYLTHQDLLFSSSVLYKNGTIEPYSCNHSLTVDLRLNQIKGVELPSSMLMDFPRNSQAREIYSHATILLEDNPFACGCGLINFFRVLDGDVVLTSEAQRIEGKSWVLPAYIDIGNLSCWEPKSIRGKKLSQPEEWMHHLLPMIGLCSLKGYA